MNPSKLGKRPKWKKYEHQITDLFKSYYPDSIIRSNYSIKGRFSGRKRQIDVLVDGMSGGRNFRQLIECKYYNRKINIKLVESILGFLDDVAANRAIIITNKGYSKSAYRRAHNDPRFIELQICSFEQLNENQGLWAMCYRGKHGLIVKAPLGWIADNSNLGIETICNIYLRGNSLKSAAIQNELVMINNYDKESMDVADCTQFRKERNKVLRKKFKSIRIESLDIIPRNDAKTYLDRILASDGKFQFSGYIEFEDFITTIDFMTTLDKESSHRPLIDQLLFETKAYETIFDSEIDAALFNINQAYRSSESETEKSNIINSIIGMIHEIMSIDSEYKDTIKEYFGDIPQVMKELK